MSKFIQFYFETPVGWILAVVILGAIVLAVCWRKDLGWTEEISPSSNWFNEWIEGRVAADEAFFNWMEGRKP